MKLFLLAAAIVALCAVRAEATQMCAPRDVLIANLEKAYEEAPKGRGLSATGNLVELLTSASGWRLWQFSTSAG